MDCVKLESALLCDIIYRMKKYVWIGVVVSVIAVLLGWGKISGTTKPIAFWNGTSIQCLSNGHTNLAMHIHQTFSIKVDGVAEEIPANIGISANCMSEVHTHDATGKIHIEAVTGSKQFTLKDFFTVWGKSMERPGYIASLVVNGAQHPEMGDLVFADNQDIALLYVSDKMSEMDKKSTTTHN